MTQRFIDHILLVIINYKLISQACVTDWRSKGGVRFKLIINFVQYLVFGNISSKFMVTGYLRYLRIPSALY